MKISSKHTKETREKMSASAKGKKFSKETRLKISLSKSGKNHWSWKGGISSDKNYLSWLKNKRNRVVKRLRETGSSHTFGQWEILKAQYNWTCPCCKRKEPQISLTEDHIVPLSKGGSDNIENIQPLCRSCNCKKHAKIIKY